MYKKDNFREIPKPILKGDNIKKDKSWYDWLLIWIGCFQLGEWASDLIVFILNN